MFANGLAGQSVPDARRPNIVLLMADDLGWKDLRCSINERLDTPNLTAKSDGEYLPARCANECIDFVTINRERPFFLCWWDYSIHYPFEAPADLIAKYERRNARESKSTSR